jgi:hypothetical protein
MNIIRNDFHSGEKITEEKLKNIDDNFDDVQTEIEDNANDISTLQNKIDDISNPLTIILTIDKSNVEIGSTINSVTLNWTCSKNVNSQTFEGSAIDSTLRTKTYNGVITSNKTFTLTATTNGGTTVTKTNVISFVNGIYVGKSTSNTYDSALVSSLTKTLSENKNKNYTVTANSNEYIYLCYPKRLGASNFVCNGFAGGFNLVATISYTNSSNFSEDYYIYKSTNANLGLTTFTVS